MTRQDIEVMVDDLISKGRVQAAMKAEYVKLLEQDEINNALLRGADYTNKTKQLSDERKQAEALLQQERNKLIEEKRKLENWQNQVQGQLTDYDRTVKQIPEMTAKIAAYEQALKDYNMFDQVQVPKIASPTPEYTMPRTQPTETRQPATNYLSKDEAGAALRDLTTLYGKAYSIQARHMKLFGEPLEEDLVSHVISNPGEDMDRYWEVKYGVAAKRAAIEQNIKDAEIQRIREQVRSEVMSELALDPSRVVGVPGNQRGLSPLLETYSQSRALAHSDVKPGEAPVPKADNWVPPEKRPEIASSRARVQAATNLFHKHFDPATALPTSEEGRRLAVRYNQSDQ